MANTIIDINLEVKSEPTVNIITVDNGTLSGAALIAPTITVVATGTIGVAGPQGVQGETNVQDGSIVTAKIANDAITSDKIADYTIATNNIGAQQITSAKLGSNSVTTVKILNNAITGAKIANNAIAAEHIQAGTITKELISDGTLQGGKLEDFTVTEGKIANNSLSTIKFQERSVTGSKISSNADLDGEVKANNLKLKGSSPATLTGPDSYALQLKTNTTLDVLNTSGVTKASIDQSGNLTLSGTVDGINISTDVAANTAKTGITTNQSSAITSNTSKVSFPGLGTSSSTALAGNTALLQLGTSSSTALAGNTALLALGTSSSTALAGNTALLALGTSNSTALAGDTTVITSGQASAITANTSKNTNVVTNLSVANSTGARVIASSDGTNATIPIATTSVSGVMSTTIFDQHTANVAKNTNVSTNLGITGDTGARVITSSDGTNATIPVATTSVSGLLTPGLFDEIDANTAKATNVSTNLSSTANGTSLTINSSDGNNASLPAATNSAWGVMSDDLVTALEANTAKTTNATHSGDVTGSGALTIADDAVTYAKMQNLGTADRVLGSTSTGVIGETQIRTNMIADNNVTEDKLADSLLAEIDANTAKTSNIVQTTISGNAGTATALTSGNKSIAGNLSVTGSGNTFIMDSVQVATITSSRVVIGQTNRILQLDSSQCRVASINLGHDTDTTLARSAAGIATIEGKQIFTTNTPALTSAAAGVPAVTMQIRRTITTAEANALNSTPIELIPAQGANTVIVLAGGMIRIDRAATQTNSAADMNLHYEGLEPGTFAQTALFHARRFMYNETGDRVFNIIPGMSAYEVAQSLTQDVNKAVEVSVDSALTSNCITSMEIYLTYNVFNIS